MEPVLRTRVVLVFVRRNYPLLITRAQAVHDGISAAPALFASPPLAMALLATQICDLRTAQQATVGGGSSTITVRNAKAAIVVGSLETLETYVQNLSDAQPDQAKVLIDAASMKVAATGARHKPELAAVNGPVSGSALLVVNREVLTGSTTKRTMINWQYSLDGKTWISAPSTLLAKTEIEGLPPVTLVSFRASATSTNGVATPWTQTVTLFVK